MIKNIADYFSGLKMTIISTIFLVFSLVCMIFDTKFIFNPAWISIFISGIPIVYKAYYKLFKCRCLAVPVLITIAMVAAIYIGEIFAAAEVALIMAIGEILENKTIEKTRKGLGRLLQLTPVEGRKIFSDDNIKFVSIKNIKKDDVLRVLPGETIPVDGIIVSGSSSINQSTLTGESLLIDKTVNDKVMAGTINCFGSIDVKVISAKDTYLQKMINLVKEADSKKAPTQKIIDKWAKILIPSALVLAIIVYFITNEIIRAVTILVVFCPCAMVLATPTSVMAAIGQATKNGVLIKSGEALEIIGKIRTFIFDKTGTVTTGKMCVTNVISFDKNISNEKLLSLISGVEKFSEHSLAKTIIEYIEMKNIKPVKVNNFEMIAGKGVCGTIRNDKIIAGNLKYILENDVSVKNDFLEQINKIQKQGKALILVAFKNKIVGLVGFSDSIRSSSFSAIKTLKSAGSKVVLLTGDNKNTANYIAKKLNISNVQADLLPDKKTSYIKELQKNGELVCMVGDGINDAPALKIANIGIAMKNIGNDIAVDAADIVLINDNMEGVSYVKNLSLETIKTIKINITISIVLNIIGISLSILGVLTPMTGAIMHNIGSIIVVLNAARLYDKKLN